MENQWKTEIDRIRQATGLPIGLHTCAAHAWERERRRFEAEGGEVVRWAADQHAVWYIGIPRDAWPEAARALLPLLLPPPEREMTIQQQAINWLTSFCSGRTEPLPAALEAVWQWREPRAVFLLTRAHADRPLELSQWQQLLADFFPSPSAQHIWLLPLSAVHLLLLVPVTALPETEPAEDDRAMWLDWAFGLHDLLTTETMESVIVCVTEPAAHPRQLPQLLQKCLLLSRALQRFRFREMVAGTWQYPLEQWAASLDDATREAVRRSLDRMGAMTLSPDQAEILDALFAHHLNISETARHLYLHRNTLLYRLDKLKDQTNLDPRQFSDAILLRLAMLFQQNA
ncbi:PucR family transcriptional regulator [Brevibacillus sp. SYP-B805]|uniref:helix-turn-helix domain-containing protein n=1 Tax=Brevibacillus sp. SYP-B805 TaxID=1578199 RepID=UPI0013ECF623|nr:PucR family transcriptional regulator [Brevibacillus sp. SYP-B805]